MKGISGRIIPVLDVRLGFGKPGTPFTDAEEVIKNRMQYKCSKFRNLGKRWMKNRVFSMPIRYNYDKGETRIESGFSGVLG